MSRRTQLESINRGLKRELTELLGRELELKKQISSNQREISSNQREIDQIIPEPDRCSRYEFRAYPYPDESTEWYNYVLWYDEYGSNGAGWYHEHDDGGGRFRGGAMWDSVVEPWLRSALIRGTLKRVEVLA